jgi:Rps23 Pro-64 3,4-dihydroxylase Tpa1-like proline 4-hydroxylase
MVSIFALPQEAKLIAEPFPHLVLDDVLEEKLALKVQEEILSLSLSLFDRLNNCFEQKYLLRVKTGLPEGLTQLFEALESENFVAYLSALSGFQLEANKDRHFHGVHIFEHEDYLDVHCDACKYKGKNKTLTVGIYLPKDWNEGGELELWEGESCKGFLDKLPKFPGLTRLHSSIFPRFNRMVIFANTERAWHGVSKPSGKKNPGEAKRLFVTASYLCQGENEIDGREKALFVGRPGEQNDPEKDAIRLKRANFATCTLVHRMLDKE